MTALLRPNSPLTADRRTEYWASLALRHCAGIGPKTGKQLLERYGNAYAAVRSVDTWKADRVATARCAETFKSDKWRVGARKEWDTALAAGWEMVPWSDERYPALLREIADPPLLLYALGDLSLLTAVSVGVVGPRRCTRSGLQAAAAIASGLSRAGVTVVSGMAWGVDREAHMAALEGVGRSVGVLGTGLDLVYPAANRDLWIRMAAAGLLVTEFAPGTPPLAHNFPQRNRIIAGLSRGVVVTEAPEKSGGLITARHALEADRDVFAVPGPPGNPAFAGCAALVEQGARAVSEAEDVLRELGPLLRALGREPEPAAPRALSYPPVWAMAAAARRVARGEEAARTVAEQGRTVEKTECTIEKKGCTDTGYEDAVQFAELSENAPDIDAGYRTSGQMSGQMSGKNNPSPLFDKESLSDDENSVLRTLGAMSGTVSAGVHIDELGRSLGWPAERVSGALLLLEVGGLVVRHPGMVYSAAR